MVTQLVEAKKVKANQYWPDMEGTTISLKGNAKVELIDTSFQGDYHIRWKIKQLYIYEKSFFRRFSLTSATGETRRVTQMQMIVWPDLGAPNEVR